MNNLNTLTIQTAIKGLKNKDFSAVDLTQACLKQIEKHDQDIKAFITVDKKGALAAAKAVDDNPQGRALEGIPIALKDLFLTENLETTAASKVLSGFIPPFSSTVVKKLQDAGVIIIGKLNCDQWGYGASGENSDYGPTKNPWDQTRVAGGSSSGSGASVAADMSLAAAGTDTGGSIRAPSSFCNVVGLKPTYGRVSRYGITAMTSSLDSIGHLTKTVWDNAKYLEVTAGHDEYDGTTPKVPVPKYTQKLSATSNKLPAKIGVPKQYFAQGLDPEVKKIVQTAIKKLEEYGAKIQEVSLPYSEYGLAVYYIVVSSETSSNRQKYDGIRYGQDRSLFTDEAKRRIMLGTFCLSAGYYDAYYKKAMQVRTLIKKDFDQAFSKVDALIAPAMPAPAFKIGAKQSPLEMYLADIFTCPVNLAGLPSLAVPCGFSKENLPIGMQIIGPQFSEEKLFEIGHFYQNITDWNLKKPNL